MTRKILDTPCKVTKPIIEDVTKKDKKELIEKSITKEKREMLDKNTVDITKGRVLTS